MDEFGTTAGAVGDAVPDELRALFNNPDDVRVQQLPCVLPGLDSLAVHFGAGARTVPHRHHNGQHLVFVEGVGVVQMTTVSTWFAPATSPATRRMLGKGTVPRQALQRHM
jgi:hypothetical protein